MSDDGGTAGPVEIPWSSDWLQGSSVPADDGSSRVLQVASKRLAIWDYKRRERFLVAPPPHPSLGVDANSTAAGRNHLLETNEVLTCCWVHRSLGMLSIEVDATSAAPIRDGSDRAAFDVTLRLWSATPANEPKFWTTLATHTYSVPAAKLCRHVPPTPQMHTQAGSQRQRPTATALRSRTIWDGSAGGQLVAQPDSNSTMGGNHRGVQQLVLWLVPDRSELHLLNATGAGPGPDGSERFASVAVLSRLELHPRAPRPSSVHAAWLQVRRYM